MSYQKLNLLVLDICLYDKRRADRSESFVIRLLYFSRKESSIGTAMFESGHFTPSTFQIYTFWTIWSM
jgi:hypothetical protein